MISLQSNNGIGKPSKLRLAWRWRDGASVEGMRHEYQRLYSRHHASRRSADLGPVCSYDRADFGPPFAAEKLAELHGCSVSRETLRGWMIADGLWIDRRHRLASPHQPHRRRDCLGELVQIDGSEHAWFEDRGETCTLLAFVDDATSRLMQLRFVASESAFDYFRTTRTYLEAHGKPVAFTVINTASSG
jgi:hypothetical protein